MLPTSGNNLVSISQTIQILQGFFQVNLFRYPNGAKWCQMVPNVPKMAMFQKGLNMIYFLGFYNKMR
jgi:hypothetical protein